MTTPRPAQLIYTHVLANKDTSQAITVVAESADGIPMGWVFCFGGRNFWEPDDHVSDRGGQMADRNRYETPLDVAEARLRLAIDSLHDCPHLWVWFAPLELLHRRLLARGKKGFLQLRAPWALGDSPLHAKANEALAWAENYVNLVSNDRAGDVAGRLGPLPELCPFVPRCTPEDARLFEHSTLYREYTPVVRSAALVGGLPASEPGKFATMVEQQYGMIFAMRDGLGAYPQPTPPPPAAPTPPKAAEPAKPAPAPATPSKAAVPKPAPPKAPAPKPPAPAPKPAGTPPAATEQKPAGLLGKLKGLLGK